MVGADVFWSPATRPIFEPLGCVDSRRCGRFLFVGAQAGLDDSLLPASGLARQADATLGQVLVAIEAVGGTAASVVSLTAYVNTTLFQDAMADVAEAVGRAWKEQFSHSRTTATIIGAQMFGIPGLIMKIHCIAMI
jgi:enamine deaminase RidA (YjgF/YER057c/UK114 family)